MAIRVELCAPLGTGKSTVAKALADHYGWMLVEEPVAKHPFLVDFYTDHEKYGFENAAFFALAYIHNVKKMEGQSTIFDAGNLLNQTYYALGKKKGLETDAMDGLYAVADALPKPDLIIYLDYPSDKIMQRISKRNRDIEKGVPESYIIALQQEITRRLDDPANTAPVLKLNMEEFELLQRPDDIQKIIKLIDERLKAGKPSRPVFPSPDHRP